MKGVIVSWFGNLTPQHAQLGFVGVKIHQRMFQSVQSFTGAYRARARLQKPQKARLRLRRVSGTKSLET